MVEKESIQNLLYEGEMRVILMRLDLLREWLH